MAVYTKLSLEEIENILSKYDLGKLLKYTGIKKGIMNSNYVIVTDKGKYILRVLEGDRDLEEEKKELKFLEYLYENEIPCPQVILNKNNEDNFMIKGKMGTIFSFLVGSELEIIDENILYDFGKMLAKMHILSENKELKRKEKIEINYLYNSISEDKEKLKEILEENYENICTKFEKDLKISFDELPGGIIHNDIFPDNVFVDNNKITGMLDFNDAMTGKFLHDIAIVLNFWIYLNFGTYDKDLIKSFFLGYEEERKLEEKEKELLPVALEKAALTFLFLRIKKFNFHEGEVEREFKDYRDLLEMVYADKNIDIWS